MPSPAYLSVWGERQGHITQNAFTEPSVGNVYQEGHEDEVLVQAVQHQVTLPRDPQGGQPSGQRIHRPLVLVKQFDKASPLLYNALASGERLPKVEIRWYRTSAAGTSENYFTTLLTDALIVDMQAAMPNTTDPAHAHYPHMESVALSYRRIEWIHEVSGTFGGDEWRRPGE